MNGTRAYFVDGVYVRLRPTRPDPLFPSRPLLGMAKREPFQRAGLDLLEPGDVWFQFGDDAAALVDALVAEVKAATEVLS